MKIGNELYSVLSKLNNQDFLLLTELPKTVAVFETNYDVQYSPSYTGNIRDENSNVDFQFCMPLGNAFQTLLAENFHLFILTIQCITVAVYCEADGKFKIFDSHARDLFGLAHPQGTCVLLDALTNYFQTLYIHSEALFELRGVHISEMRVDSDDSKNSLTAKQIHPSEPRKVFSRHTDKDKQSNNSNKIMYDNVRNDIYLKNNPLTSP